MSDQPTATATSSDTGGDPSGTERAVVLAKNALAARLAEHQRVATDKQARLDEQIASIKALLINTWDILGIDPDTYAIGEHDRPAWTGSLTLTDPDEANPAQNTVTIETGIILHSDGLYFRAGCGKITLFAKRGNGTLPETPPSDKEIGDMVLNGWLGALQGHERERQSTLDSLLNDARLITDYHNGTTEENLSRLALRVSVLKPGDLPEPYNKSLAQVNTALTKANKCVEARLEAHKAYIAAATKVKIAAAKWKRRQAAWDDECASLARTLTEHHFKPFIVYEIRYTAIGVPVNAVDENGDEFSSAEEIHTLQSPLDIANQGQAIMVNAVDRYGNTNVVVIGAFLDGRTKLNATDPPAISTSAAFYRSRRIGESSYYANFPPTMSKAAVDEIMNMLSFPLPPAPFADTVLAELQIRIDDYNYGYAAAWDDVDPKTLRTDILKLNQKPEPEHTEEDKDVEIPF